MAFQGKGNYSGKRLEGGARRQDVKHVAELVVDHEAEEAHLRGAAVVELDGALGLLGLLVEGVPAEVNGTVAEIARELARLGAVGRVLHHEKLEEAHESEDLEGARHRHLGGASPAGLNGREGGARVVDVTREAHARGSGEEARHAEHANAAVLELHVPEAVEALLVGVVEEAERVPAAERRLSADLGLEGLHHGLRGHGRARRSHEGGGRSHGKSKDDGAEHLRSEMGRKWLKTGIRIWWHEPRLTEFDHQMMTAFVQAKRRKEAVK